MPVIKRLNVDEMHTFNGSDLLGLDGKVMKADGKPLKICPPKPAPKPPKAQNDMFGDEQ